jgi:hypothetical protein
MKISRRDFIESASGAAACAGLPGFLVSRRIDAACEFACESAVLDLGPGCELRESLLGYRAILGEANLCAPENLFAVQKSCRNLILPGLKTMDERTASALLDLLGEGGNVLLESGAGFLAPMEFAEHQAMLQRFFGIAVNRPVDGWAEGASVPYVHYDWPHRAMVRDFSRVIPALAAQEEVIGRIGALPVALRKRVGNGFLVFLGSPLGPALYAGDREARMWLQQLVRAAAP